MTFNELKFTVNQVEDIIHNQVCGETVMSDAALTWVTDLLNKSIRTKLDAAPLVDGYIHSDGYILMDRGIGGPVPIENASHHCSARLVDITAIPSDDLAKS